MLSILRTLCRRPIFGGGRERIRLIPYPLWSEYIIHVLTNFFVHDFPCYMVDDRPLFSFVFGREVIHDITMHKRIRLNCLFQPDMSDPRPSSDQINISPTTFDALRYG